MILSNPSPREALDALLNNRPIPLAELTGGGGLYSLTDEHGVVRYIGETGMPFFKRIHGYHCAGDDNSHKFSTVFNAGRLWAMSTRDVSPVKRALHVQDDANIAKAARRAFARARCHARVVDVPNFTKGERLHLESAVLAIAPRENTLWNDSRALNAYEPSGLDEFIAEIAGGSAMLSALSRQAKRWDSLPDADRCVIRKAGTR